MPGRGVAPWMLVFGFLVPAALAHAQDDFRAVRLKPGDVVYVTPPSGLEVRGRVTHVTPSAITVDGVEFRPGPGLRIQRRGDQVWDGLIKGLVIGGVVGVIMGAGECDVANPYWACVASGVAWFGALGTVVDALHVGRTTVYIGTSRPSGASRGMAARFDGRRRLVVLGVAF